MEEQKVCKYDMLDMLNELNYYAIENNVNNVSIENISYVQSLNFIHFDKRYENGANFLQITSNYDTNKSAYEKYERMMKCMKEGALL